MQPVRALNLIDVDGMVEQFLQERYSGVVAIHRMYFQTDNQLSLYALLEMLKDELRTGCVSFINKGSPLEELSTYLFYIVNAFCRKLAATPHKKKSEYICPGCLFLGMATLVSFDKTFQCEECHDQLKELLILNEWPFTKLLRCIINVAIVARSVIGLFPIH